MYQATYACQAHNPMDIFVQKALLFALLLLEVSFGSPSDRYHDQVPQQYVVYMGSSSSSVGELGDTKVAEAAHLQLLSSVIPSSQDKERISLIHHYTHAFNGFSALLTKTEASFLSGADGVVSVFIDKKLKLQTTRSWEFLEAISYPRTQSTLPKYPPHHHSSDVIVGLIDSGIWPESPSFNDEGMGKIPSKWKGICMQGDDFKKSNCNKKLIGARYYDAGSSRLRQRSRGSPRDNDGHGTHTSSIIAGAPVANASYHGLAAGIAKGGSISTRLAIYKACTTDGCSGSTILKAIDDAIGDGVDIISISIGMGFESDFLTDPIAIGAFHAQQKGVMVVCAGGNDGPDLYSVVNSAPWIFTVAASNIDRDFQSAVVLGNGDSIQGSAINFSNLTRSMAYPLALAQDVASNFSPPFEARSCYPGSLDAEKVAGKIVVCTNDEFSISREIKKLVVEDAKAKGMILISKNQRGPFDSGVFPFSEVGFVEGNQILSYVNSTREPRATILPTVAIKGYSPAPSVALFSSRGPGPLTENILKPDITAPGVAILGAWIPETEEGNVPTTQKPSGYAIKSGTSMACPHVAGAAAFIKSLHHDWSSSMIKSALMTTATVYNNIRKPLTNTLHKLANPHEIGAGEINPLKAIDPGLVFETTMNDYLQFLCNLGHPEQNLRLMSKDNFNCPKNQSDKVISDMNYPSISIGKLDRHKNEGVVSITRRVTNVGSPNSTYIARIHAPKGLLVKVSPRKLVFSDLVTSMSFRVVFYGKDGKVGYNFGDVTWSDGKHLSRLVFAVNVV